MAEPKSIAEARKQGKSYFIGKDGKRKAAVTKEDMKKAGFKSFGAQSLRKYLNQQKKEKTPADVKKISKEVNRTMGQNKLDSPKPKSKNYVGSSQRPDSSPVKSTTKSKKPEDILGTREKSRAARRARQEAKTKADTSMTPEQKLTGQIGISTAAAALIAPVAIPFLIQTATKHGPAFAKSLGNKIKNLTSGQQKKIAQEAKEAPTKTQAQKNTDALLKAGARTQSGRKPLSKERVEPYISKPQKPLTPGQSRTARTFDAAKQVLRKEIDPSYTGAALKKGGPIKKYNQGGKVVKRMGGGKVMSGNDLVSSLYD